MDAANPFDFFFQWHLTEWCNLSCRHCCQDGKPAGEMTPEEIDRTITILADTICQWSELYEIPISRSITVTGGEPFLRPDLFRILASLHGNDFDLSILTNGTLIDRRKAALLAEIPVKGVQVSMEGPEKVHDHIRGKGSFQSAIRGVTHLLSQDLGVTLNFTLSTLNADYLEEMAALGSSLGVQRIGFSRLVPSGRGLDIVTGAPLYCCATDDAPPKMAPSPGADVPRAFPDSRSSPMARSSPAGD
jgi:AdoMet-dependent heme synthase